MITTNPYLNFPGTCEEAFRLYEKTLGGKILMLHRARGTPMESQVPADRLDKIMHIRMEVGGSVIMGSDTPPDQYSPPKGYAINVSVDDPAEADRIFAALAEGGKAHMPIAETFWARRFGMCVDRFGTPWMVNCEKPM